jgi:hypothetical protein
LEINKYKKWTEINFHQKMAAESRLKKELQDVRKEDSTSGVFAQPVVEGKSCFHE